MEWKEREEKKRNVLWWVVTIGASVVILFVVFYFIASYSAGNPLKGRWISEDTSIALEFQKDGTVIVENTEDEQNTKRIEMVYTVDKSEKIVEMQMKKQDDFSSQNVEDAEEEELTESFGLVSNSFAYTIQGDTLNLTEREYGEQLEFTRE